MQWYQPENAWCERGLLIIESRRERRKNPDYQSGMSDWRSSREYAEYTAASLMTKGLQSWRYGRFEMRGRIDTRPGLWPAFWTLGVDGEWPSGGEIDIMEYTAARCWPTSPGPPRSAGCPSGTSCASRSVSLGDPDWSAKFHVWRMDWDERAIRLSVDGLVLNTTDLEATKNRDAAGLNPFHFPQYLLLSLAIGGANGGDPSPTTFPARFEVDYVRVYQR